MPEPIKVKLTFLFPPLWFSLLLGSNVNSRARFKEFKEFHISNWASGWYRSVKISPRGLLKSHKCLLVSATAYSHLHVNGLYGPERWSAPTTVIGSLRSRSIEESRKTKTLLGRHTSIGACLVPQRVVRRAVEICRVAQGSWSNKSRCAGQRAAMAEKRSQESEEFGVSCEGLLVPGMKWVLVLEVWKQN